MPKVLRGYEMRVRDVVRVAAVGVLGMVAGLAGRAQAIAAAKVAPTPPMGWNSWDAYGLTITELQFRENVQVLTTQLKPLGWNYAVIDEGWFFYNPEDRPRPDTLKYALDHNGRYVPVVARFPSAGAVAGEPVAADGMKLAATINDTSFKPLADFVHAQGLKFGIHIVRGIPRAAVERNLPIAGSTFKTQDAADTSDACPWDPTNWGVKDTPAGQAWYDSLLAQYAAWGVDLLKVDCISDHPYKVDEIRMLRKAIDKTGRPIVLSLSPGPTNLSHVDELVQLANMWRISDDIWDYWANARPFPQSVTSQFARLAAWARYAGPGHWPDADMLPLGELRPVPGEGKPRSSRLTPAEARTQMTLWAMARSPLIVGANLTLLDGTTRALITNPDVIGVDQKATGSREASHSGEMIAWTADLPGGFPGGYTKALALFNMGEGAQTVNSSFEAYGLDATTYTAKDAWAGKVLGKVKSVENLTVEPHATVLWLLRK
jgi:alpha-galactosidase